MSLVQAKTLRFEPCMDRLWFLFHPPDNHHSKEFDVLDFVYGIIYSDIPFPKGIKNEIIEISYHGKRTTGNVEINILSLDTNNLIQDDWKPYISESFACLLTFAFRKRFAGSRHWGVYKEGKFVSVLFDLFLRLSVKPSRVKPLSAIGFQNGVEKFNTIFNYLKVASKEEFYLLMKSFRLYHLALLTFPIDVGLSYSLLVSSIENLSNSYIKKKDLDISTDDVIDGGWKKIFTKHSVDNGLKKDIEEKIRSSKSRIKSQFVHFIETYLPLSFWESYDSIAWEEDLYEEEHQINGFPRSSILEHNKEMYKKYGKDISYRFDYLNSEMLGKLELYFQDCIDLNQKERREIEHALKRWDLYGSFMNQRLSQDMLPNTLKEIYDSVRSAFYHRGESPPRGSLERYEIAPSDLVQKGKKAGFRQGIPSWPLFERIVHDTLYEFLRSNASH